MTFAYFLRRAARYWGDNPAVLYRDRVLTYRQLDERSTRLANALLALGLRKGDRVAIQSRNCPEIVEIECALYKAGLVKAALNPRFTANEASDVVENCTPRVMIAGPGYTGYSRETRGFGEVEHFFAIAGAQAHYGAYEALIERGANTAIDYVPQDDDLAVLHFSSGSTGKIKAAMQSYGNRWRRCAR
jgi:acyl-CoA synthetase (AMP-forming)/AMP-acid ligase II